MIQINYKKNLNECNKEKSDIQKYIIIDNHKQVLCNQININLIIV